MQKHVVVIGCDHGGAWVAARVKKSLRGSVKVSFVCDRPEMIVLPSLTASIVNGESVRKLNFRQELSHLDVYVIIGNVVSHDPVKKRLFLDHATLDYDLLVVDPYMELIDMPGYRIDKPLAIPIKGGNYVVSCSNVQGLQAAFSLSCVAKVYLCTDKIPGKSSSVRSHLWSLLESSDIKVIEGNLKVSDTIFIGSREFDCGLINVSWKEKDSLISQGLGVYFLPSDDPYWPVTGISAAQDAALWVSAYLSGKPKLPLSEKEDFFLFTPLIIRVGNRIVRGRAASSALWVRNKNYLDF